MKEYKGKKAIDLKIYYLKAHEFKVLNVVDNDIKNVKIIVNE